MSGCRLNPELLNSRALQSLPADVFKRDDYTCAYCGKRGGQLECDHIEPLSRGGSNNPENLTTSCKPCNRAKRAKTIAEWRP